MRELCRHRCVRLRAPPCRATARRHPLPSSNSAKKAFGRTGVIVISACFMLECAISGGVSYMLVFGTSLHALFPSLPLYLALLVAGAVMTPTTWLRDLSVFSYLSLLGIATSCFLVGVLLYSGFTAPEEEGSLLEPSPMCWFNTRDVAYSIGLWMVGFGGHPSLPSVYVSMQDRGTFPRVLDIAFALTTVIYGGTAAAGYMMYGPDVRPEISLNLPHGALTTAVLWALLVSTLCKFAMAIVPVSAVLEDLLEASGLWTVRPLPPWALRKGGGRGAGPAPWHDRQDSGALTEDTLAALEDGTPFALSPDSSPGDTGSVSAVTRGSTAQGSSGLVRPGTLLSGRSPALAPRKTEPLPLRMAVRRPRPRRSFWAFLPWVAARHAQEVAAWEREGSSSVAPSTLQADLRDRAWSTVSMDLGALAAGTASLPPTPASMRRGGGRDPHSGGGLKESLLHPGEGDTKDGADEGDAPDSWASWVRAAIVRSLLGAGVMGMAIGVPDFGLVMALAGSVLSFFASVVVPPAMYAQLFKEDLSRWAYVAHWAIAVLGLIVGALGTAGSAGLHLA